MKTDRILNLFWLFFGLFLMVEGRRLHLGELRRPGSGLFPFLIGIFLVSVSLVLLFQTVYHKHERREETKRTGYRNLLLCLFSLYTYVLLLEPLGFLLTTFFFIIFLLKMIEQKGWILVVATALATAVVSYIFFEMGLRAALPKGMLGFIQF